MMANEIDGDDTVEVARQGDATATEDATTANVSTPDDEAAVVDELDLATWLLADEATYSILYALLNQTGLTEQLSQTNPLTLFAPGNDAFAGMEKYMDPEWSAHLYDILLYHIVPGVLDSSSMTEKMNVFTTLGENFTITSITPTVTINNISTVVDADNEVSNGLIHGISSVLLPPSAVFDIVDIVEKSPFFREFLGLLVAAGLDDDLRGPGR
jgi:uncharacterized surface protein with fasciclin (FAS1) repeats